MFSIGDTVYMVTWGQKEKTAVCPDCQGKKFLTVILGDDSKVTIDCATCADGYDPPKGYVYYWEHTGAIEPILIQGVCNRPPNNEYYFDHCHIVSEDRVFATPELAKAEADRLAEAYNKDQIASVKRKYNAERTWAWNLCYHRKQLEQAKKDILYHSSRLEAAKRHVKKKTE